MATHQENFQQQPHDEASREIVLTAYLLSVNDILVTKLIHANAEDVCVSTEWEREKLEIVGVSAKILPLSVITICHDSALLSQQHWAAY